MFITTFMTTHTIDFNIILLCSHNNIDLLSLELGISAPVYLLSILKQQIILNVKSILYNFIVTMIIIYNIQCRHNMVKYNL